MQAIERIKNGWKQFRTCSSDDFAKLIDHIDKLEAENERLRKDAERRPMTNEEIDFAARQSGATAYTNRLVNGSAFSFGTSTLRYFVRSVEAFHGIKGTP